VQGGTILSGASAAMAGPRLSPPFIMGNLVIVGAGGHGSELYSYTLDITRAGGAVNLIGFLDDHRPAGPWEGADVLGRTHLLASLVQEFGQMEYLTAFGSNSLRRKVVGEIDGLRVEGLAGGRLLHPSSQVGRDVELGRDVLLAPGVIITRRVQIGNHCILNVKASISHDCVIGDYVNINPGAILCGNVRVGDGSFVGAGAVVKEGITIGRGVVVGAGAAVVRDLPDGVTAVGVPARPIKENPVAWLEG
jgi:sugar O-acyltransferase (sialic acid O-acetyltransferase NeuD family)